MYFWHVCLGFLGSLNDIQVMGRSTITMAYLESPAASIKYTIGDTEFEGAFFLADGIYPNYAYLMKTISEPATAKEKLFAKCQEGCRKDVERAFGRLLSKWHILDCAARTWFLGNVCMIWRACFLLHNMTLRDNQDEGYDSDGAAVRDRELRREHARVRRMRRSGGGGREREGGGAEGGATTLPTREGGEAISGTTSRRRERLRIRRLRRERCRVARGLAPRGGGGEGAAAPRPSVGERCDLADESHDTHGQGVDMSVHVDDWEMVLRALKHAQCQQTNILLKQKTVDSLWLNKGAEV